MSSFDLNDDNVLYGKFVFNNFIEAMEFVNKVAIVAESQQHHPDIKINYNQVELFLSTHDAGGIVTSKDTLLAGEILKLI